MTLKLLLQNYNQTSKSTYFLLEAVLNLRPVEPALSHEKGATISLATDACHTVNWFLTLFRVSYYIKKKPSIVFKSNQQITKFRQSILHSDIGAREKKIMVSLSYVSENKEVTQTRKDAIKSTFWY